MARKKPAARKSRKKTVRGTARRLPAKKKTAAAKKKKKKTAAKKTARKKTAKKKPAAKKAPKKKTTAKKKTKRAAKPKAKKTTTKQPLGRPRVTLDARLDLLFQKDYQAREVFEYLRIHTVRELQEYSPDEIIKTLAGPLYQTVQRIRKTMALCNRCLADDLDFALEFKQRLKK